MSLDHENGGCDNVWACAGLRCYLSRPSCPQENNGDGGKNANRTVDKWSMPGKGLIEKGGGSCSMCVSLNGLRRGRTNTCSHIPLPKPWKGHGRAAPWD